MLAVAAAVHAQTPRPSDALSARVQALEDREAIRTLWAEYGRTLDARDKAIGTNYPNSKGTNFHLYFNESVEIQGDTGTGVSKGGFVMGHRRQLESRLSLARDVSRSVRARRREMEVQAARGDRRDPRAACAPVSRTSPGTHRAPDATRKVIAIN